MAGATVELRRVGAVGSAPMASAVTGPDGLASLPRIGAAVAEPLVVVARAGDDWAYRAIPLPAAPEAAGLLFTERGIYRPGERVSLEGMFRVRTTHGLVTPGNHAVDVWVVDPEKKEIARSKQTLGSFGTFTTEIPIRRDASLGDYRVHASFDGVETWPRGFTVQEYRPAESTAEVTADREEYVRGDTITCAARGRYLYGGPMTGAQTSVVIERRQDYYSVPGLEAWFVGDHLDWRAALPDLATAHGQLDAAGTWSFRAPLATPAQVGPEQLSCAIEIADKNRQITSATTLVRVHPARSTSPLIALETAAIYGETSSAVAERLADLGAVRDDAGGLSLTLASTPLASLARGIEALLEYPHGCTEQTVSRMLPLLALRDLATQVGDEPLRSPR